MILMCGLTTENSPYIYMYVSPVYYMGGKLNIRLVMLF